MLDLTRVRALGGRLLCYGQYNEVHWPDGAVVRYPHDDRELTAEVERRERMTAQQLAMELA